MTPITPMSNVEQRVYSVLSAVFQLPPDALGPHLSPETVEGWDSLRHLDLTLALEEEFGLQFTVDEISGMQDAAAIVAAVGAHRGPGS